MGDMADYYFSMGFEHDEFMTGQSLMYGGPYEWYYEELYDSSKYAAHHELKQKYRDLEYLAFEEKWKAEFKRNRS
jgi:hypothetical protein